MPWVAAAMGIASSIGGAISKNQEMKAQEASHKYNAAVSKQAALDAERDGRQKANQQRKAGDRLKGQQRAAYAASGAVLDTGSPLEAAVEQAGQLEMAALDQEIAANREGQQHRAESQLQLAQAKNVKNARRLAMVGAIVGTGGSMFNAFGGGGMGGAKSASGAGGTVGTAKQGNTLGGGLASAVK